HFAALPKIEAYGTQLDQSLEMWCHQQVIDQDMLRTARRAVKKHVVGIKADGNTVEFKVTAEQFAQFPEVRGTIEKKYPGIAILNGMTDEQMLAALKGAAR